MAPTDFGDLLEADVQGLGLPALWHREADGDEAPFCSRFGCPASRIMERAFSGGSVCASLVADVESRQGRAAERRKGPGDQCA